MSTNIIEPEPVVEPEPEGEPLDLDSTTRALSKVRKEAAESRTALRDFKAQMAEAKTPAEVDALISKNREDSAIATRALTVENVALLHNLPPELAGALKGGTREELEAHALMLSKFAPSESPFDPDLHGGLDGDGGGPSYERTAALAAVRTARRGY